MWWSRCGRSSLRCCRIWTSGNSGWCWPARRARWATVGSPRWSRPAARRGRGSPRGIAELEAGQAPLRRVRREGGGRKPLTTTDPALLAALLALVEPTRRGDPCSPLCWTTLSTRKLAAELTSAGHPVGADTVARLLREQGFSLQANAKTIEGGQHPDRDAQFCYLNDQVDAHLTSGDPVISVDTKKKELVGPDKNGGAEWPRPERPSRSRSTTSSTHPGQGQPVRRLPTCRYQPAPGPRRPGGSADRRRRRRAGGRGRR